MLLTAGLLRRLRCRCTLLADGDLASASAAAAAAHSTHAAASTHHAAPPRALAMRLATPPLCQQDRIATSALFHSPPPLSQKLQGRASPPQKRPAPLASRGEDRSAIREECRGARSSPPVNLQVGVAEWECGSVQCVSSVGSVRRRLVAHPAASALLAVAFAVSELFLFWIPFTKLPFPCSMIRELLLGAQRGRGP